MSSYRERVEKIYRKEIHNMLYYPISFILSWALAYGVCVYAWNFFSTPVTSLSILISFLTYPFLTGIFRNNNKA